jgi:ferredoxin-NADP reductase
LTAIFIQSPSPVRHAFYETFLHIHQLLVLTVVTAVYIHLNGYARQQDVIKGVIAIWIAERTFRLMRLVYRNVGRGGTQAEVTALEGDVVRLKVRLARPWKFEPGQHAYVYMPFVGLWTSHPFSVAWSDEDEDELAFGSGSGSNFEKDSLPKSNQDVVHKRHSNIYFLIRKRTGFTHRLWLKARNSPMRSITTRAIVEGPYSSQRLDSYGTAILFAAGIGITHQIPHVRELVRGYGNGTVATRRVILVWTIQAERHLEWIREWMVPILALPRRREVLKILLFVTRPEKSSTEVYSPSSSVQMFLGRPNIQAIVDQEVEQSIGAIGVSVCGTGAVADDVRKACREWMGKVEIDFEEESFSW